MVAVAQLNCTILSRQQWLQIGRMLLSIRMAPSLSTLFMPANLELSESKHECRCLMLANIWLHLTIDYPHSLQKVDIFPTWSVSELHISWRQGPAAVADCCPPPRWLYDLESTLAGVLTSTTLNTTEYQRPRGSPAIETTFHDPWRRPRC